VARFRSRICEKAWKTAIVIEVAVTKHRGVDLVRIDAKQGQIIG
jgi:hypothetical protein